MLKPYAPEAMEGFRVPPEVNSPMFDGPQCILPA